MQIRHSLLALIFVSASFAAAQKPAPLVIISIDGMKPEYVTQATEHGLKVPELRTFLTQGTYAEGVVGVLPTVTYPSHTTLMTGVWPAEHGVVDNTTFDPMHVHPGQWYWDFSYIKVATLYTAAHDAGLKTGAVSWPVTVGAPIDYNIADDAQSEPTDKPNGKLYAPADILAQIGSHSSQNKDAVKAEQALGILKTYKPTLLLVHFVGLDHQEHEHEPFSAEADATLETIDGYVAQIEQAALAIDPRTRIAVVSDHGFLAVQQHTNLNVVLAKAGLITLSTDKKPKVVSWEAQAWPAGGSDAIMLHDPTDKAMVARVRAVLDKAKAEHPEYGLDNILTHDETLAQGGFPMATFWVDYRDGFAPGGALAGEVVTPAPHTGMHGYLPSRPSMRSTFMIKGDGIAKGRDLKVIDMRQIAPTFAGLLDVKLPAAKLAPVDVAK